MSREDYLKMMRLRAEAAEAKLGEAISSAVAYRSLSRAQRTVIAEARRSLEAGDVAGALALLAPVEAKS